MVDRPNAARPAHRARMALLMRTIDRYVLREILPPFFISLLIYTFILEIPPVMRDLEKLVAKGVSWGAAGRILLTLIPQGLGLTIPMATLTGILWAWAGSRATARRWPSWPAA